MNKLECGKHWLATLSRVMPDASVRMVTRMAWHLAALSVKTDDELSKVPDAALAQFHSGHHHFLDLRAQYLRRQSLPSATATDFSASFYVRQRRQTHVGEAIATIE
jgi:hypothetical protein